jgi:hypothetical protein
LKVDSFQQGASSSGIPPQGADDISQPSKAEKITLSFPMGENGTSEIKKKAVEATQNSPAI